MVVAPPGHLKTTALLLLDHGYQNAQAFSFANSKMLDGLRGSIQSGRTRSLIFPELRALFVGDPRTGSRTEETIMQLAGEGYMGASWQDARFQQFKCRATVFAAMPFDFFELKAPEWEKSGFLRRFIWCAYTLADPEVLMRSLMRWERAHVNGMTVFPQIPIDGRIEHTTTDNERVRLAALLKHQPGPNEIRLVLLSKALSALKMHYKRVGSKRPAIETFEEFGESLGKTAAKLEI
jgi:hypothetical protein